MIRDPRVRRAKERYDANPCDETARMLRSALRHMLVVKPPEWDAEDSRMHVEHMMDNAYCKLCEPF